MRAVVDLAKLVGVDGDIVLTSTNFHGLAREEDVSVCLHADDIRLDAEADEVVTETGFPAGYLFRRRYD